MINLLNVCLDKDKRTLLMECENGILAEDGKSYCNVTKRSKIPYIHFELNEVIDGSIVNQGIGILWGMRNKKNIATFGWRAPAFYLEAIRLRSRSFNWVTAILYYSGLGTDYVNQPDENLYEDAINAGYDPIFSIGRFETRRVFPYIDKDGKIKNLYTCFIFPWDLISEERISRTFIYHHMKLTEKSCSIPVQY